MDRKYTTWWALSRPEMTEITIRRQVAKSSYQYDLMNKINGNLIATGCVACVSVWIWYRRAAKLYISEGLDGVY